MTLTILIRSSWINKLLKRKKKASWKRKIEKIQLINCNLKIILIVKILSIKIIRDKCDCRSDFILHFINIKSFLPIHKYLDIPFSLFLWLFHLKLSLEPKRIWFFNCFIFNFRFFDIILTLALSWFPWFQKNYFLRYSTNSINLTIITYLIYFLLILHIEIQRGYSYALRIILQLYYRWHFDFKHMSHSSLSNLLQLLATIFS